MDTTPARHTAPHPAYRDGPTTLYQGDSLTPALAAVWLTADVLVTDPPYGTQEGRAGADSVGYGRRQSTGNGSRHGRTIAGDTDTTARDRALALWGNRPALVFASPRMPEPPGRWDDRLVWNKRRPGMNGGPWRYTHEMIYVRGFVRRSDADFSILTVYPRDQDLHIHAKPVPLMEALLGCAPDGVVCDPFAGAGATLIAARNLGLPAVGVEIDPAHCATAARRLARTPRPLPIPDRHDQPAAPAAPMLGLFAAAGS